MKIVRLGFFLLLASVVSAGTVDFTAKVAKAEDEDRVVTGTLHVQGNVYRLEFPDPGGPEIVSISDPANDVVRVLVPRYGMYMEDEYSSWASRMNDPFAVLPTLAEHYQKTAAGQETISGVECTKETWGREGQVVATVWRSERLGFPLKLYFNPTRHVLVSDVTEGAVSDELMKLPEGFVKADREAIAEKIEADPEMQAKRAAYQASLPVKSQVSKRLTPGAEFEVLLGQATKVTAGLPYSAEGCKWRLEAYRGEDRLDAGGEPYVGQVEPQVWKGEKVPDRIVARGVEGDAYFEVKLRGKAPLLHATRYRFAQHPRGGPDWTVPSGVKLTTVRILALAGEENRVQGVFRLSDDKGKSEKEPFTLKPGEAKTFECPAELGWRSIGFMISYGETHVEVVEDYRDKTDREPF